MADLDFSNKVAVLEQVQDPDFDQVDKLLEPEFFLPLIDIQTKALANEWVKKIDDFWNISGIRKFNASKQQYAPEVYQSLVYCLLAQPYFLNGNSSTIVQFVRLLRDALLQIPTATSSFLMSQPILQYCWPQVSKHPMLPLWLEMNDDATMNGILFYFINVESTVSESMYMNSSYHPFIYDLIEHFPQFEVRWVALVDEFVQEAFPDSTPLPKLTSSTKQATEVFATSMSDFHRKEMSRSRSHYAADAAYGLLMRKMSPGYSYSGKLCKDSIIEFCNYSFRNLSDRKGVWPAAMAYLRWLHKVAALVGKPMPMHLLSEVFPG